MSDTASGAREEAAVVGIEDRYASDDASRPFWAGLAAGRLVVPWCRQCESAFFFPRPFCPRCWSDAIEWVESPGTGTVFARTDVHVAFQDISKDDLPFTVALVDLDEGVRLPARLQEGDLQIGERVKIRFADDPTTELPRFARLSTQ